RCFSESAAGEPCDDSFFRERDGESVERDFLVRAIDRRPVTDIRLSFTPGGRFDSSDNRQLECFGEFPIALILPRYSHDGPGAVTHEDVIGDPDRHVPSCRRVEGITPGERAAFARLTPSLNIAF